MFLDIQTLNVVRKKGGDKIQQFGDEDLEKFSATRIGFRESFNLKDIGFAWDTCTWMARFWS